VLPARVGLGCIQGSIDRWTRYTRFKFKFSQEYRAVCRSLGLCSDGASQHSKAYGPALGVLDEVTTVHHSGVPCPGLYYRLQL
jgi:hypothetical protein